MWLKICGDKNVYVVVTIEIFFFLFFSLLPACLINVERNSSQRRKRTTTIGNAVTINNLQSREKSALLLLFFYMFVCNVLATTVNAYLSKKIIECLFLFNIIECDLEKKSNSIASIIFFFLKDKCFNDHLTLNSCLNFQ